MKSHFFLFVGEQFINIVEIASARLSGQDVRTKPRSPLEKDTAPSREEAPE